jgi:hypothetical protein
MRTARYTSRFRRDYRREKSGRHGRRLDAELLETVTMLVKDEPLPRRYPGPGPCATPILGLCLSASSRNSARSRRVS